MCGQPAAPGGGSPASTGPASAGPASAGPASVAEALAMARTAAGYLAQADLTALPAQAQGEALLALERLDARLTAAHARLTAGFAAAGGPQADGAYSVKTWLRHHARITGSAAGNRVKQARLLAAHPQIAAALAGGGLSPSWARLMCGWTGRLPAGHQQAADEILVSAAGAGAGLDDLAVAAEAIHRETCPADPDDQHRRTLDDRAVYLGRTFGGAGRLEGDLTPGAAAALAAVLAALGSRAGPEDHRSLGQRNHDALAEGCRRILAAGALPQRAGQDTRAEVTIPLRVLRQLPGAAEAEDAWISAVTGSGRAGPEAAATACDTTIVPVVTGQLDRTALDQLTSSYLIARRAGDVRPPAPRFSGPPATTGPAPPPAPGPLPPGPLPPGPLPDGTRRRVQATLLRWAIEVLSGPGGLASYLRTSLLGGPPGEPGGPLATPSLPLDTGQVSETIPLHLRRAVTTRDRQCAFPGCQQAPGACQIHHLIPRHRGGPTAVPNLILLCPFHHLIVIHTWGWTITLHPDGTTTATSPHGRILHSHDPPRRAG